MGTHQKAHAQYQCNAREHCEKVYQQLGLKPLDQHIRDTVQANKRRSAGGTPDYRGLGSTTWMVIRAIMEAQIGSEVLLIGTVRQRTQNLKDKIMDTLNKMGLPWSISRRSARNRTSGSKGGSGPLGFGVNSEGLQLLPPAKPGVIYWGTRRAPQTHGHGWILFEEEKWERRIIRRAKGPFEMAQEIRLEKGLYNVYAEEEEFLFSTTKAGAGKLVLSRGVRNVNFPVAPASTPWPAGTPIGSATTYVTVTSGAVYQATQSFHLGMLEITVQKGDHISFDGQNVMYGILAAPCPQFHKMVAKGWLVAIPAQATL